MLLSHALRIVFWSLAIWTLLRCSPHLRLRLLAKFLFASDNNALQFEFQKRQDLISAQTHISTLHGVEQHDEFLNNALAAAQQKITIISPGYPGKKWSKRGF